MAEAISRTPAEVDDEVFAEARRHFSDEQLVELAATVAMENYRARFNRVFAVESQHFYAPAGPSAAGGEPELICYDCGRPLSQCTCGDDG